ncbi:MAG: hypothetical protein WB297_13335, partial [Actinomycetota bacterium]
PQPDLQLGKHHCRGVGPGLLHPDHQVRENQSGSWECEWTTFLNDGADSITVESPCYDTGLGKGAITGGTGAYVGASGSFDLGCSETECTFTFTLS